MHSENVDRERGEKAVLWCAVFRALDRCCRSQQSASDLPRSKRQQQHSLRRGITARSSRNPWLSIGKTTALETKSQLSNYSFWHTFNSPKSLGTTARSLKIDTHCFRTSKKRWWRAFTFPTPSIQVTFQTAEKLLVCLYIFETTNLLNWNLYSQFSWCISLILLVLIVILSILEWECTKISNNILVFCYPYFTSYLY